MFSSLTSILPSGIGFGAKGDSGQDRDRERTNDEKTPRPRDYGQFPEQSAEGKPADGNPDEHGVKKKRERNPYEVRASLVQSTSFVPLIVHPNSMMVFFSGLIIDIHRRTTASVRFKSPFELTTATGTPASKRTRSVWLVSHL